MKKILIVDNNYPINSRNIRIKKSLDKKFRVKICGWDRLNKYIPEEEDYVFSSNHGYGKRIKKVFGMFSYFKFIKNVILVEKPNIIIASQWDMLFLVSIIKFDGKIIYENLDIPSLKNKFLTKIALFIEGKSIKKIDGIIFASRFFEPLYKKYKNKKITLENLPSFNITNKKIENLKTDKKIRISFIGGLRYFNILKNLLEASKNLDIDVYLIGKGPDEKKIKDFIQKEALKNIYMIGEYNYEDIKEFYMETDCVWAVYPSDEWNVKYAISNKFFESIIFEKPCVFSNQTLLGDYVRDQKIGWIVNESSVFEIKEFLNKLSYDRIVEIEKNIRKYKTKNKYLYWEDQEEKLIKFVEELS